MKNIKNCAKNKKNMLKKRNDDEKYPTVKTAKESRYGGKDVQSEIVSIRRGGVDGEWFRF